MGARHGGVEVVLERPEHADQGLVVEGALLVGQRRPAGLGLADPDQGVVQAGQRHAGVRGLDPLTVRVKGLGQRTNFGLLRLGGVREGEGVEAPRVAEDRVVPDAHPAAGCEDEGHCDTARQHAQDVGVVGADRVQLVVRANAIGATTKNRCLAVSGVMM